MLAVDGVDFEAVLAEMRFAYEHVPFLRDHLDSANIQVDQVLTPAAYRSVPPTSKADYRRHFPTGVMAWGSHLDDDQVYLSHSSGTTGDRLTTAAHTHLLAGRMTTTAGINDLFLPTLASGSQRTCRYAAPNCSAVECATPASTVADRTLPDGTLVLTVAHDLLGTPEALMDKAIGELLDYQPRWLYADPTHLAFLVRWLRRRQVPPPRVAAAVLTYSLCTQAARRQISDYFGPGTTLVEILSMSELGWFGAECHGGSVHLNTECFYFEVLAGGRPADPGELGELVVTSLGDRLSPRIRYRTGDFYTVVEGVCDCGLAQPRVLCHGRARDVIAGVSGTAVTPLMLDRLVGPADWLQIYKLRQSKDGSCRLRYVPVAGADHLSAARVLREDLARVTGRPVSVQPVTYIESERSGKFLSCVVR